MTYSQSAHISDLQARNTELVSQVRILTRALADRGPAISAILCAHHRAIEKHQQFPAAIDSQGTILAEELLEAMAELNAAGLAVLRAINDHRDEAPCLDRVCEELGHVGAVVLRALERFGVSPARCAVCGRPYADHPGVDETCRAYYEARTALVKILAACDALGDGGKAHQMVVRIAEREIDRQAPSQGWRLP